MPDLCKFEVLKAHASGLLHLVQSLIDDINQESDLVACERWSVHNEYSYQTDGKVATTL